MSDSEELERVFREIEADVADEISYYYNSRLLDGSTCRVLYYFWVMQAICPSCHYLVDLFSNYVYAKHAYPRRNPVVASGMPEMQCP